MNYQSNRRDFLKQGVAVGCCAAGWTSTASANAANGKIQLAAIGVGGKGWSDVTAFASHPQVTIAALCDVDGPVCVKPPRNFPRPGVTRIGGNC